MQGLCAQVCTTFECTGLEILVEAKGRLEIDILRRLTFQFGADWNGAMGMNMIFSYTKCSDNDADISSADEIVYIILWKRPIEIF